MLATVYAAGSNGSSGGNSDTGVAVVMALFGILVIIAIAMWDDGRKIPKTGVPLSRREVRDFGRSIGLTTGLIGYVPAVMMGGCFDAMFTAPPHVGPGHSNTPATIGAILGIITTFFVIALWKWRTGYAGRPFMMAGEAVAGAVAGFTAGVSGAVLGLLVVMYALAVALMWVLASAVLIFAVVT